MKAGRDPALIDGRRQMEGPRKRAVRPLDAQRGTRLPGQRALALECYDPPFDPDRQGFPADTGDLGGQNERFAVLAQVDRGNPAR